MTTAPFESIPIADNGEELVDLRAYPFELEPMYFRQGVTPDETMYLRRGVADKLAAVQRTLGGLRFKIWDGWRPRGVQRAIYDRYRRLLAVEHPGWTDGQLEAQVETFVTRPADPTRIPPHATGSAVDLTLIAENGYELDMGTGFDDFTPEAASRYFEHHNPESRTTTRDNRRKLRRAMTEAGFRYDDDEWWHYDFGNQLWA